MDIIKLEAEQTMTLKEITDLLEVRHNDAMAVVRKLIENQEFGLATKVSLPIVSGKGREQLIETYQLNKRQSIAVAAKLNTSLLMRIIDRWQELEQKQQFVIPQTLGEALRLAADLSDRNVELTNENLLLTSKIEQAAPKLEVYEAIVEADSGIRITEFARVLSDKNSIGRNKLYSTLREWKILDRNNVPYQRCIDAGWFYVVERPWKNDEMSGINFQVFLTGKGQSYIINRLKKENLI